ncbi:PREDICTED: chymotrypsin-1-like [Dufourea novaeangliae]|uniref:chymotrypsin-1-like n=1 Tax=Dufourea novaeangliae TaxID=178035 RepID=UPI000767ABDC|nr:PREDICTED: chymotrypsin-1-like [Dufourea novaeangliae]
MNRSLVSLFLVAVIVSVSANLAEKLVGTQNAQPGQFPYVASIRVRNSHICSGSIISKNHILTAQHCLETIAAGTVNDVTVVTGTIYLDQGGTTHSVVGLFGDGWQTKDHDISVIKLGNPITFNEYQQSIALATARSPEETYAVVTGWGSKSGPPSNLSNVQQYLNARIIKFSDCHNIYDDITTGICTVNEPNIGTCTGDIGSPLVYNKRVIGVVSRDVHCAKGMPDLYTSTYDNKEFIRNAMKE